MEKNLISQAIEILGNYVQNEHGGNKKSASEALGMNVSTGLLGKWLRGERVPSMTSLAPILEKLGVSLKEPTDTDAAKDVCFVDAKIAPAGEGHGKPDVVNYLAVPVVGEAGAGPGIIPQDEVMSWFLVYKNVSSIQYKRDLIAVMVGPRSTSMEPLLHPGDIVLVDRSDRDVTRPGHIMLVMEPDDGAGKIKRVAVEKLKGEDDTRITFYSDNASQNPPEMMRLNEDYGGDINKAIVGRVVWAWSDISNK